MLITGTIDPPSEDSSTTRDNITVDWESRIVDCPSSITDVIAFHNTLRALEASPEGMIYPPIIKYQEGDLGGGAKFPIVTFINSYQLRFPNPGNYAIRGGNVNANVVPVAGVFVERFSSAAYAITSVGSTGGSTGVTFTPQDVANSVWSHPAVGTLVSNIVNSVWAHAFVNKLLTVAKFLGLK
jgi:hypothetical protein